MMLERGSAPTAGEKGFTLIEVVVAMVILAIGLLGLQALGIGTARAMGLGQIQSEYAIVASSVVEDVTTKVAADPASFSGGREWEDRCYNPDEGQVVRNCVVQIVVEESSFGVECADASNVVEYSHFDIRVSVEPEETQNLPWGGIGYSLTSEHFLSTGSCQ